MKLRQTTQILLAATFALFLDLHTAFAGGWCCAPRRAYGCAGVVAERTVFIEREQPSRFVEGAVFFAREQPLQFVEMTNVRPEGLMFFAPGSTGNAVHRASLAASNRVGFFISPNDINNDGASSSTVTNGSSSELATKIGGLTLEVKALADEIRLLRNAHPGQPKVDAPPQASALSVEIRKLQGLIESQSKRFDEFDRRLKVLEGNGSGQVPQQGTGDKSSPMRMPTPENINRSR